jgi:hypothetical protein
VSFPESVYSAFEWLRARPTVHKVYVPRRVFIAWVEELSRELRFYNAPSGPTYAISYRGQQFIEPRRRPAK